MSVTDFREVITEAMKELDTCHLLESFIVMVFKS
jgi:hypothetical protein